LRQGAAQICRRVKRFRESRDGVTAIEFAFIAPVFFLLLFSIIESGLIYFAQSDLQQAVNSAGRLVRTGEAQSKNMTAADFRATVCSKLTVVSCDSNLEIDLTSYGSFSTASFGPPLKPDGTVDPNLNNFSPGISGQVVLLRGIYVWKIVTPLLTPFLSNMANDGHLIVASTAFRNEPF
jgi:Flp pilus assembly protein TadG